MTLSDAHFAAMVEAERREEQLIMIGENMHLPRNTRTVITRTARGKWRWRLLDRIADTQAGSGVSRTYASARQDADRYRITLETYNQENEVRP